MNKFIAKSFICAITAGILSQTAIKASESSIIAKWDFSEKLAKKELFCRNKSVIAVNRKVLTPDGKPCLEITMPVEKVKYPPILSVLSNNKLFTGQTVTISFQAKCSKSAKIRLVISGFAPPYKWLSNAKNIIVTDKWQTFNCKFTINSDLKDQQQISLPLFVIKNFVPGSKIWMGNAVIKK